MMNPFSSPPSSPPCYYHHHPLEMGNGEDSGAGSEEGLDVPEEPLNLGPHRPGSKRSRAAEVHNMSEKRRRSRINEKMKALQNLIPNSNKTDKASMLDEAIEYLKQLQLQVQMLSMRNSLNSHPMYLPGSMHPLQASQLCLTFGDSASAMNMSALGMLSLNQDSSMNNSFDPTSQCTTSHQAVMIPTTTISAAPEPSFCLDPLKTHYASFQLRVPAEELFKEDMISQQQLDSGRTTGNLSENVMKTLEVASLNFGGQASSSLEHTGHPPEDNPIFAQNFDGLQRSKSFTEEDASQKL